MAQNARSRFEYFHKSTCICDVTKGDGAWRCRRAAGDGAREGELRLLSPSIEDREPHELDLRIISVNWVNVFSAIDGSRPSNPHTSVGVRSRGNGSWKVSTQALRLRLWNAKVGMGMGMVIATRIFMHYIRYDGKLAD